MSVANVRAVPCEYIIEFYCSVLYLSLSESTLSLHLIAFRKIFLSSF